jgi:hypothetical protein
MSDDNKPFTNDDKKELLEQVKRLMKAADGKQNSHDRELIRELVDTSDTQWQEVGKMIADQMMEMAYSPRLSGLRWILFCTALDKNDTEKLAEFDAYYQEGCDHFLKRFGEERLWENVSKSYDGAEARQALNEKGLPITLTNLVLQAFPKLGSKTGDEND